MSDEPRYRLVSFTHYRCADYDGKTYALAPVEWTEKEIREARRRAQVAYLAAVEAADKAAPKLAYPHASNFYKANPHLTVAECDKLYAAAKEDYDASVKIRRALNQRFWPFLKAEGFVALYEDGVSVEIDVDWGHRHGQPLDYHEVDGDDKLPTVGTLAGLPGYEDEDFG